MNTKESVLEKEPIEVGMEIGPLYGAYPIISKPNTKGKDPYFAIIYYHRQNRRWYGATKPDQDGLVVFLKRELNLGEILRLTEVAKSKRYAHAKII